MMHFVSIQIDWVSIYCSVSYHKDSQDTIWFCIPRQCSKHKVFQWFRRFPFHYNIHNSFCYPLLSGLPAVVEPVSLESAMPDGLFAIPLSLIWADRVCRSLRTPKGFPSGSQSLHLAGSRGFLTRMLYVVIRCLLNIIAEWQRILLFCFWSIKITK